MSRSIEIVAHRGAMDEAPENTASAFEIAAAHGVDGIELDVQMSADGVLVICHDPDLTRLANDRRSVADCTYDELSELDWGAWYGERFRGEPLLTLQDCLTRFVDRVRLLVEIKSFPEDVRSGRNLVLAQNVIDTLDQYVPPASRDRISVLSFDPQVLAAAGESARWRCVRNLDEPAEIHDIAEAPPFMDAYCASIHKIDTGTVDACHRLGRRFMTWTCNTAPEVEKAVTCGCDVIMTDRPGWLVNHLDERNHDKGPR